MRFSPSDSETVFPRSSLVALCIIGFLGFTQASSAATTEAPNVATLRQQVNTLNSAVLELQARLRKLEKTLKSLPAPKTGQATAPEAKAPAASVPAPASVPTAAPLPAATPTVVSAQPLGAATYLSPEARLRHNWSLVERDMRDTRVHQLLGNPSKKFKLNGRTVWYYYYPGTGVGSVFFTHAGRVSSSQSPFGFGW